MTFEFVETSVASEKCSLGSFFSAHVLLPRVDPLRPPSPETNINFYSCPDCRALQQPSYGALTTPSDVRPHFAPSALHSFPIAAQDGWTCQDVVEQGAGGLCPPQEARKRVAAGRFRGRNPQNVSRRAVAAHQALSETYTGEGDTASERIGTLAVPKAIVLSLPVQLPPAFVSPLPSRRRVNRQRAPPGIKHPEKLTDTTRAPCAGQQYSMASRRQKCINISRVRHKLDGD